MLINESIFICGLLSAAKKAFQGSQASVSEYPMKFAEAANLFTIHRNRIFEGKNLARESQP